MQEAVVEPQIVVIAVFLAEIGQGVLAAGAGEGIFARGFDVAHGAQQPVGVALGHDASGGRCDGLDAAAGAVGHDRRAAGYGLEVDGRVVVLIGRVDERRCGRVELREHRDVLGAPQPLDPRGQAAAGLGVDADHYQCLVRAQARDEADEVVEALFGAPYAGQAEDYLLVGADSQLFAHVAVGVRAEDRRIDAVVDDLKRVFAQERARHLAAHPLRDGHDDHAVARNGGEPAALVGEVAARAVDKNATGECAALRTVAAAALPAVAACKCIMIAVSGVEPAVVDGPDDPGAAVAEVFEKYRIIQEVAVDVVDVDDVGVDVAELPHESAGRAGRSEAVAVEGAGDEAVQGRAPAATDRYGGSGAGADAVAPSAVGAPVAPAGALGQRADLLHDAPRRRTRA